MLSSPSRAPRGGTRPRRAAVAGAVAAAITLAACSVSTPLATRTSPTPSAEVAPDLAAAEAKLYASQYTDAGKAFQDILVRAPQSAEAHARYALFLNYQHRYPEALTESRTAVGLDETSVVARAIDTRVHDWSAPPGDHARFKEVADIGAEAVRIGPKSALAHTFYSEALADSGNTDAARAEIDAASPLAGTAYERAEVEREKATLATQTGDKAGGLAHFQAAADIQPEWAERIREVAAWYHGAGQTDKSVALFNEAIQKAPQDAELRLSVAGIALEKQDMAMAATALGAANDLKPHDSAIESTLAMAEFSQNHDTARAEALLRGALADSPSDGDVADLLDGFLRYIKKDTASADQVRVSPPRSDLPFSPIAAFNVPVTARRAAAREAALKQLNLYRSKAHLPDVRLDDRISKGASAHSYWWLFNLSLGEAKGLGIHHEVPGTPGFTGFSMRDRAVSFGFPRNLGMGEVIDHTGTPESGVTVWIDSVYHRFPLMAPDLDAVGFGEAIGGGLPIETMDVSFKSEVGDVRVMVPYPADGQADVPRQFTGNELPDPVPGGYTSPTGYPITVNFNSHVPVAVSAIQLKTADGADVAYWSIPPALAEENVLTILPKAPLKPKTTYQVHIGGQIRGIAYTKDWSFTTES
ncbi:MAG: hypothetical protein QOE92_957 [Chloroflexota bacterium]|jgi:tetratricopeptide (TPR) repeat protein|nr:hypothetical protein [Chloroflexota bacterium]